MQRYIVLSIAVWIFLSLEVHGFGYSARHRYYISWFIAIVSDTALTVLSYLLIRPVEPLESGQLVTKALRICFLVLLPCVSFVLLKDRRSDLENQALLASKISTDTNANNQNQSSYGTCNATIESNTYEHEGPQSQSLWKLAKGLYDLSVFIWPRKKSGLILNIVIVSVCILISRFLNVLAPRQIGILMDELHKEFGWNCWLQFALFLLYEWLTSNSSVIHVIQKIYWIPIQQYTFETMSKFTHNYIMKLSYDFHTNKRSSFSLVPQAIDFIVAAWYLSYRLGTNMFLCLVMISIVYHKVNTKFRAIQTVLLRDYYTTCDKEGQRLEESVRGWRTVSMKFVDMAVEDEQRSHRKKQIAHMWQSVVEDFILRKGYAFALILAMLRIKRGKMVVRDLVTLMVYCSRLIDSLRYFASLPELAAKQSVLVEKLFETLHLRPTIKDRDGAAEFILKGGEVKFDNVSFYYHPLKKTLEDVSFVAAAGKTTALVGESGGGKSTLLCLIFRFFDVVNGFVKIDGQDVREVTLESLRQHIGVVPQDPALFNETIAENVRYARENATEDEVIEACKAAGIHDNITSFPEGYNTVVGEGGFKLSGGERQRIAIARAVLKRPKIFLLDEATSNVDSETEGEIQQSLKKLTQGCTTISIAHRLSTIMDADQIVVVGKGGIVEKGTHDQLLELRSKYYSLWTKQTSESGEIK
ncbi:MAG: hypothetical protein M1840_000562 [Geoglossum simile]|nr:MAG: hypothetical protein M1840_000562 [Geoglossum simile]